jgi:P-type E1-E2 ATPase
VLIIEIIITNLANKTTFSKWLDDIANAITLAICIIVVAVPEGLPLTINLALAYSVGKMEEEKILIRTLPSVETIGGVEEICTGKTGTLTKNDMRVEAFYTQSRLIHNTRDDTFLKCDLLK